MTNILGYLTLAAILAAIWILFGEDPTRDQGARGERTFAGLSERVNEAAFVSIIKEGAALTLTKDGDVWRIGERGGFPANAGKVRAFLRGLALSERREPKTANPDRFDRLGLAELAASVVLKDDTGGTLLSVKVGVRKGSNNGRSLTYVFQETDTRSWLVTGLEETDVDPVSWLEKELLTIDSARIASLTINDAVLSRVMGETDFTLEDIPEDAVPVPSWQRAEPAQVFSTLLMEDTQKINNPLADSVSQLSLRTHDGLILDMTIFDYLEGNWMKIEAMYDAEAANIGEAGVLQGAPEYGVAEAADLNERINGWLFKISDETAQMLKRRKADFIETTETNASPS